MYNTLLITRVDMEDHSNRLRDVFFQIYDMVHVRDAVMDIMAAEGHDFKNRTIYKYNGISVSLETREIPQVIELLIKGNISLYSVYEPYDPYSSME